MPVSSIIQRWGLIRIFAFSSFISIATISVVSGYIFFSFLHNKLLEHEVSISSEFIQSVSLINNPESYFVGGAHDKNDQELQEYFHHIIGMPGVLAATAYNVGLTCIWSSNETLIGKTFKDNDELKQALKGQSLFEEGHTGEQSKQEHSFMPEHIEHFIEIYISVWDSKKERVIGVVEIYKSPSELYQTIYQGRVLVTVVSLLGGVILFWVLYWIVRTAHLLIENQRARIKQATSRTVELNELNLRRIGADLHDGPAQSIGFALLRMDSLSNDQHQQNPELYDATFNKINNAMTDALQEIRNLSSGLIIPELNDLSFKEALINLIKKHENRTSTKVKHHLKQVPEDLRNSTKICIYRLIQEGLNNAYRHGKGMEQCVELILESTQLHLIVTDSGPGMTTQDIDHLFDNKHLGIRGLRERVESLGGHFQLTGRDNLPGVRMLATLPI